MIDSHRPKRRTGGPGLLCLLLWAVGCDASRGAPAVLDGAVPALDGSATRPDAAPPDAADGASTGASTHLCDLPALDRAGTDAPVRIDGTYEVMRSPDVHATLRADGFEETVIVDSNDGVTFPRTESKYGLSSTFYQLTDCLSGCLYVSPEEAVVGFWTTDLPSPRPGARVINMAKGFMDLTLDDQRWAGLVDTAGSFALHWPEPFNESSPRCALTTRWFLSGTPMADGTLLARENLCAPARCMLEAALGEESERMPAEAVLQLVREWRLTPREVPAVTYQPLPLDLDAEPLP